VRKDGKVSEVGFSAVDLSVGAGHRLRDPGGPSFVGDRSWCVDVLTRLAVCDERVDRVRWLDVPVAQEDVRNSICEPAIRCRVKLDA
jgi:hypothetical protein